MLEDNVRKEHLQGTHGDTVIVLVPNPLSLLLSLVYS